MTLGVEAQRLPGEPAFHVGVLLVAGSLTQDREGKKSLPSPLCTDMTRGECTEQPGVLEGILGFSMTKGSGKKQYLSFWMPILPIEVSGTWVWHRRKESQGTAGLQLTARVCPAVFLFHKGPFLSEKRMAESFPKPSSPKRLFLSSLWLLVTALQTWPQSLGADFTQDRGAEEGL